MMQVHATCVAIDGTGVLLRGPAGSGKSDLALRLIDGGARLVADDRVILEEKEGRLIVSAPAAIRGLMEVRGIGILRMDILAQAPLGLVIDLVASDVVERLPEAAACEYLGQSVRLIRLAPFEASAAAKVRLAVGAVTGRIMPVS